MNLTELKIFSCQVENKATCQQPNNEMCEHGHGIYKPKINELVLKNDDMPTHTHQSELWSR